MTTLSRTSGPPGSIDDGMTRASGRELHAGGKRELARPTGDPNSGRVPMRRRHVWLLAIGIAAMWLVAVFAGSLSESNAVAQRAELLRQQNDELRARLEAGRAEVALIQGEDFLRIQARGYGLGERGEHVFALSPDAPPPTAIVPLGGEPARVDPPSPLEDWLDLLFGRG